MNKIKEVQQILNNHSLPTDNGGFIRDSLDGSKFNKIAQDIVKLLTSKDNNIMKKDDTKEMEATTIAHLTGQMVTILEMIEFSIQQTGMADYKAEYLMKQINDAKTVNDEIFEMHKRNELNRIKKIYNDLSNESNENK